MAARAMKAGVLERTVVVRQRTGSCTGSRKEHEVTFVALPAATGLEQLAGDDVSTGGISAGRAQSPVGCHGEIEEEIDGCTGAGASPQPSPPREVEEEGRRRRSFGGRETDLDDQSCPHSGACDAATGRSGAATTGDPCGANTASDSQTVGATEEAAAAPQANDAAAAAAAAAAASFDPSAGA
eukprot:Tamp_31760.p1 GENE.Tamp_31760~~Tamp_31760.p1  ORF type:complete len:194 (+),score=29.46 Tamp_31760:36-584(+)